MFKDNNLTEIEVSGLHSKYNLSDGHSYLEAETYYADVLSQLPAIWAFAAETSIPDMEVYFKNTFANFHSLSGLKEQKYFSICPTASNSIDLVGAWARATGARVGLIEPTFDNLALLLRRREVDLYSIDESTFNDLNALEEKVRRDKLTALFLVNPNNPTGGVLGEGELRRIFDFCAKLSLTLLLDTSFRFCHKWPVDEYRLLQETHVPFIILEDTGKVWPTLDTKVSILAYSAGIAPLIRKIYEELYLCSSNLSLAIVAAFIESTQRQGAKKFIHDILQSRMEELKATLVGLPVTLENSNPCSHMSVAWLNISGTGMEDLEFLKYLKKYQLSLLPGRYFYWDSHQVRGHHFVRLALLKPEKKFRESLRIFRQAVSEVFQNDPAHQPLLSVGL